MLGAPNRRPDIQHLKSSGGQHRHCGVSFSLVGRPLTKRTHSVLVMHLPAKIKKCESDNNNNNHNNYYYSRHKRYSSRTSATVGRQSQTNGCSCLRQQLAAARLLPLLLRDCRSWVEMGRNEFFSNDAKLDLIAQAVELASDGLSLFVTGQNARMFY